MAINPQILAKIFGGTPQGMDPQSQQQVGLQSLQAMGASMLANSSTNTGRAPGFGQVLGQGMQAGAQAQQQGIANAQTAQANQMALEQAQQEKERRARFLRMLGGNQPTLYGEAAPRKGEGGQTLSNAQGDVFAGQGLSGGALGAANQIGQGQAGLSPGMDAPKQGILAGLPPQTRELLMTLSPEKQEAVLTQMAFPKPQDEPARIQEARLISQQTGQSVADVLKWMRDTDGQDVNVEVGGAQVYTGDYTSSYAKQRGADAATDVKSAYTAADSSASMYRQYQQMNDLLDGIETGAFTGSINQLAKVGEAMGIDTGQWGENIGNIEAAQVIESRLAMFMRNPESGFGLPGATSNRDIQFLMSSVPNVNMTPEGRALATQIMGAKAQLDREIATAMDDYILEKERNGEPPMLDSGWRQVKQRIIDNSTAFSGVRKQAEQVISQQGSGGGGAQPGRVMQNPRAQQQRPASPTPQRAAPINNAQAEREANIPAMPNLPGVTEHMWYDLMTPEDRAEFIRMGQQ